MINGALIEQSSSSIKLVNFNNVWLLYKNLLVYYGLSKPFRSIQSSFLLVWLLGKLNNHTNVSQELND
jgi:hypothetical protein